MIHLAWSIWIPESASHRLDVLRTIRTGACEAFNLCVAEGCRCKTGVGKKVCREEEAGKGSPVLISEGPSWTLNILALPDRAEIHLYYGGPLVGREVSEFIQLLGGSEYPVFQTAAAHL